MELNKHGVNTEIKGHILSDEEMKKIGFTDHVPEKWYFMKMIAKDISFNVAIPKDGSDISLCGGMTVFVGFA